METINNSLLSQSDRQRLSTLERDAERTINAAADLMHKRLSSVLQDLLRGEARQFSSALESLLRDTLERTLAGTLGGDTGGTRRRRSFPLSALQSGADALAELERSRRNS